ncbi:LOW QUALITY PROTEIN: zinc finger protein 280A-like [Erinaceus europaeus]|uniref:LOW QUALITY PROTEIN: zinc finger protein 280A-like n=1 Tax=Erinaceus europaeus TaxID=9365 RepID=A0A1S3A3N9_ERIEU|nr:LOW QUALITY PROTEIN: zinc finger protein 280A-like [Erinaceus europaeus]
MAHLLLYKKEQIAEPPKKNTGDFKHRESEDAELVFVGVEYVNEDDDILFVQVISKPKPVASKILNRATRDSEIKRGVLNQDPAHTLQTASHNTPRDAILLSQSECLAIDSPSLLQPSSHPGYEVRSLQVMHQNTSDLLSQGHCGTKVPVRDQDDPEELFILDIENENIKRPKLSDGILKKQYSVIAPPAISPKLNTNRPSEGIQNSSSYVQAGASYPWIYTHGKAHFSCMDPGRANRLEIQEEANFSSTTSENRAIVPNQENLIMLLHDFYYGQHKGDRKHPEQKIYKTFKCSSCLQILKNVKFMNHVSHHLELERQRVDSWEIHTNCRHCHRRFCTPFELQCHVESVHTAQEAVPLCKICELSFKTNQALLEHMKYNHKPGEMPYVCQVQLQIISFCRCGNTFQDIPQLH